MRVLVTGANGFVGSQLISHLGRSGNQVIAAVRSPGSELDISVEQILEVELAEPFDWSDALDGVDVVIHLAARVHIMNDNASDPLAEFRRVNSDATLKLAHQAAEAGVKRFIFLSTIKVNGESTSGRSPFSEKDVCNPTDPYAISKMEAEQGLMQIAKATDMGVVIIRPPLVYGPGVKGNFASIFRWVGRGLPLPFGEVKNRRSLLALDNLVSFIICCLDHPKAANQVFLLSDGEGISTPVMIKKLAHSQGKKARLLPIPVSWMKFAAKILGKGDITDRLFGSLEVNSLKAREFLEWSPVVSMDEQLNKMLDND